MCILLGTLVLGEADPGVYGVRQSSGPNRPTLKNPFGARFRAQKLENKRYHSNSLVVNRRVQGAVPRRHTQTGELRLTLELETKVTP